VDLGDGGRRARLCQGFDAVPVPGPWGLGRGDCWYGRAFTAYVDDLAEQGVEPDADRAWDMYRYGTMLGLVYPVIVAGGLTIEDPRHVALAHALLVRSLRAIDLLDAFNLPL
jgi:hypothetical protein